MSAHKGHNLYNGLYKSMYIAYNVELMLTSLNNTINYY